MCCPGATVEPCSRGLKKTEKAMASRITSPIVDTTVGDTLTLKIFIEFSLAGLAIRLLSQSYPFAVFQTYRHAGYDLTVR